MEYESYTNYERDLRSLMHSLLDIAIRRRRVVGAQAAWLNPAKGMALVTASAERSWLINDHRQQQRAEDEPVPHWQVELESWARSRIDQMWHHIETGTPLNPADFDPDVFPDHRWMHQTDLTLCGYETFQYVTGTQSTESAATSTADHLFSCALPDFWISRQDWYNATLPAQDRFGASILYHRHGLEPEHPRVPEFEAWARTALDAMWDHLATGDPIRFTACDPGVFPKRPKLNQTDLASALGEAFEYTQSLVSAETACHPILHSQCWFLGYLRVDLREHRGDWYASIPEIGTSESACYVETNAIQFLNPLRIAPERWLDRDLTFVERSSADVDFVGLRDVATNDVRVALGLKDRLHEVVVPATGPITSAVWPPELCELVDAAIDQTCRQPPPA